MANASATVMLPFASMGASRFARSSTSSACRSNRLHILASSRSSCAPVRLAGALYTYPYSASMASYSAYSASASGEMLW